VLEEIASQPDFKDSNKAIFKQPFFSQECNNINNH